MDMLKAPLVGNNFAGVIYHNMKEMGLMGSLTHRPKVQVDLDVECVRHPSFLKGCGKK